VTTSAITINQVSKMCQRASHQDLSVIPSMFKDRPTAPLTQNITIPIDSAACTGLSMHRGQCASVISMAIRVSSYMFVKVLVE
jgi:hypothetical protein